MDSSKISMRLATLADRQGVLAIDPMLFGGLDYMSTFYTTILQNPAYRPYVAETQEGKIVSFITLRVDAEEGICGILSGRTHHDYRSQGIVAKLGLKAIMDIYAEFGRTFDHLSVASDKAHVYTQEFWSDPARSLIQRHAFLVYIATQATVMEAAVSCMSNSRVKAIDVKTLSLDRAHEVLLDKYTLEHVLRKSHLIAFGNHLPIPKSSKYLRLTALNCNVLASFKAGSTTQPNGVSYSSLIKGPAHVLAKLFFSVYEHIDILLAHLSHHLVHVANVVPPEASVIFLLDFPTEIDKEAVKDFLLPILGVNSVEKDYPMEYMLLWKDKEISAKL